MRAQNSLYLAIMLGAPAAPARGQWDTVRADLHHIPGDVASIWSSPVRANARDLVGLTAAVAATVATATGDERMFKWAKEHPDAWPLRLLSPVREAGPFDLYELGSFEYLEPISAVLYLSGLASHSSELREAGLGCATAHMAAVGPRYAIYMVVGRERPRSSPGDPYGFGFPGGLDWDWHSFYAGHASNSMACASFLSHRFHLGLAEPLIYGVVMAVSAGRVADGRHWPSDIVAGGIVGYAIGKALSDRYRARDRQSASEQATPAASPFTFRWSFSID